MGFTAPRFFVNKNQISNVTTPKTAQGPLATITGGDARHICVVLRMRAGEQLVVCDGEGADYLCELTLVGQDEVHATVLKTEPSAGEPPVEITLLQSLPRSDKFEYIIQKCVELGIYGIVPVVSEHTQYSERARGAGGAKLMQRWRRIAYEAAKQSGRGVAPEIAEVVDFKAAAGAAARDVAESPQTRFALVPYENEEARTLKSALTEWKKLHNTDKAYYFIGPEGGFSVAEIEYCQNLGIAPVTLGPRVLRTETAGLVVLSQIMYEFT